MPNCSAANQDVRRLCLGHRDGVINHVRPICIPPRDVSYKKRDQCTFSPGTGAPSDSVEEGRREPQDEGSVAESRPCPGLCRPGNSS